MNQTRLESLLESIINISSGFLVSLAIWSFVIIPIWNIDTSFSENLTITGIFTISSIIRSYLWRRFFNAGLHKMIRNKLRKDEYPYEFQEQDT